MATTSYQGLTASELTEQAKGAWSKIRQHVPTEKDRHGMKFIVEELQGRFQSFEKGNAQSQRRQNSYSVLSAEALAAQTRFVCNQIRKNLPSDQRKRVDLFEEMSDRLERIATGESVR